ncbi:alginate O-acetyltransferase AlgX-related protein [Bacillus sp. 3255]|uniref:alginate O-acetyltransferase AlgX-related protein n=1 Tax=Bacillus sp. 3255 TaxID=2817904 RepID=UPI00285C2516|nr:hypothetical protein [Bacillus sp. 3255]MDR6878736.1 hypothetical protein [Bacillus sp. 3255]
MKKYRLFFWGFLSTIFIFMLTNLVIFIFFTADTLTPGKEVANNKAIVYGDMARLSFLNTLRKYDTIDLMDSRAYIKNKNNPNFSIVTIGDSFTDYRDYHSRIANILSDQLHENIFNITNQVCYGMFDFLVSDIITSEKRPKVVIWESVERNAGASGMFDLNNWDRLMKEAQDRKTNLNLSFENNGFYKKELQPKISLEMNNPKKTATQYIQKYNFLTTTNLKFLANNISYFIFNKTIPKITSVDLAFLKTGQSILYYHDDISSYRNSIQNVQKNVEFVKKVKEVLNQYGIELVFYVVPDKYDAYHDFLQTQYQDPYDNRYLEELVNQLNLNDVNTINVLPAFKEYLAKGNDDLYLKDDTHWNQPAKEITSSEIGKLISDKQLLK